MKKIITILKTETEMFNYIDLIIGISIFILSYNVFLRMYSIQIDLPIHLKFCIDRPFYFGYNSLIKVIVYIVGLGKNKLMFFSYPFTLALSVVMKYFCIRYINADFCRMTKIRININDNLLIFGALLITFSSSIFSFLNFPSQFYFRDTFSPAIWHNPTTIILFPFALLLFWFSFKVIFEKEHLIKNTLLVVLLVFMNVFIKPVFLMPFFPCFLIAFITTKIINKNSKFNFKIKSLWLLLPTILLSIYIFICFYKSIFVLSTRDICFSPLKTFFYNLSLYETTAKYLIERFFNIFSSSAIFKRSLCFIILLLHLIFANAFNISTYPLIKTESKHQLLYALSIMILGLLISFSIMENGSRASHGNFTWHIFVCVLILMVSSFNVFIYYVFSNESKIKLSAVVFISFGILVTHFYCGIIYLQKIIFENLWF